ncbi:MAG: ABC transporter permease subunit [Bacillota bacterium]
MNIRLAVGIFLTALIVAVAIFGPWLAPYEVSDDKKIEWVETEDGMQMVFAPAPPSRANWFGTNRWGYDILTLLLYGARYTVFSVITVALVRVVLGGLAGLLLGLYTELKSPSFNFSCLGVLPLFVIVYFFVFGININSTLSPWTLVLLQVSLLSIFGIPGVAAVIQQKTGEIKKQEFVLAARTIGAGKWRLAFKHILPFLKETLVILAVHESIAVLNIQGQLGIFNMFLGGTVFTPNPMLFHSRTHEWAGLVGQAKNYVSANQWILAFPLLAFMIALVSLYYLSRGLEDYYRDKYQPYRHA